MIYQHLVNIFQTRFTNSYSKNKLQKNLQTKIFKLKTLGIQKKIIIKKKLFKNRLLVIGDIDMTRPKT